MEEILTEVTENSSIEDEPEITAEEPTQVEEVIEDVPAEPMDELEEAEQFVIDGFLFDDEQTKMPTQEELFSKEVDEMLAQADELIAHQTPDPVVTPEPIEISIPDPILPETEEVAEEESANQEPVEEIPEETAPVEPEKTLKLPEEEPDSLFPAPNKKNLKKIIVTLVAVLLVLVIGASGWYYRENIYLQAVDNISIDSFENQAIIHLDTQIDNELLTVICTDIYGNTLRQSVMNNTAIFTSLNAGTSYKVSLLIDGNHKLVGNTTATFSTPSQTNIVSFTATAGDQDGAVILNFSVQGTDSHTWHIFYSAEGEPERNVLCSGHMAIVTGLTLGKNYTFRLVPEVELYLVGNKTLEYTAQAVVYPENLTIQGYHVGNLLVTWDAPQDAAVESWIVRCFNEEGFDQTYTVTDTCIAIEGLDPANGYTVEVKASGMSVSKWVEISANSITFKDIVLDDSVPGQLTVDWDFEGIVPEGGWILKFTIDGKDTYTIPCEDTIATISPLIPGATYTIGFEMPEGITIIGGTAEYTVVHAAFDAFGVQAEDFYFRMCWTPDREDWYWNQLWEADFTNTFRLGEAASFVIHAETEPEMAEAVVSTLFLIRNASGAEPIVVPGENIQWNTAWDRNYTQLDMPLMPGQAGEYTVEVYFNNLYVASIPFTVTE